MQFFKKVLLVAGLGLSWFVIAAPSFDDSWGKHEIWYSKSFEWIIKSTNSLADNIRALFFPSPSWSWWVLFEKLRIVGIGLIFLFLVWAGAMFLLHADNENEVRKAKLNIVYIFYWAFLFFWATWILGKVLGVGADTNAANTVLSTQSHIIWWVLIFFKSFAYYLAIIMMVYYWVKIMQAQEKEDKIKQARSGAINVILALIAIKVLDYVYYIAQNSDFVSKWSAFISSIAKALGWVLGIAIVLALLYSGALLIASKGNEESWKKAKIIVRNVFLVIFVVFLFIVIVFDLFRNIQ